MLCLVRYLFVISTSVIDWLGRFVPEMNYYVSSGALNLAKLELSLQEHIPIESKKESICQHLKFTYCQCSCLVVSACDSESKAVTRGMGVLVVITRIK